MKTRIFILLESLKSSFWFIPALMICAAIIISFTMVTLDRGFSEEASQRFYGFMLSVSPEGARSVLSTIAGSMMTVAGVTFSITIVVLNLASSQFGPRLLRNFIEDRGIQFVLGTFVSSFIYCLLVLRSVESIGNDTFVPSYSVTFSVVLAFLNVAVLIYFIHHIATSIQADEVIAKISAELQAHFRQIFTEELDNESTYSSKPLAELQEENAAHFHKHSISACTSGYLQAIDLDKMLQLAKDNDLLVYAQLKAGRFVVAGSTLAIVSSSDNMATEDFDQAIRKAFIIGSARTSKQDAEYSVHQLVEIAVRALSPGINDPYTAIDCIDQLGAALCFLGNKEFPLESIFDDKGKLRLLIKPFTYAGILNASFDQIRQYGSTSVAVTVRLLEMLVIIAAQTGCSKQRKAIYRQANMILRTSREVLLERNDKKDVFDRYRTLLSVLNKFNDQATPYAVPEGLPVPCGGP
jgi:uncharacterized membrane protein